MNNNLNKVKFTTDADRYELTLPVKSDFVLERNIETVRYYITVKNFSNLKNSETMSYTVSGDTIEECFLTFGKGCPKTNRFVDQNL